MLGKLLKHEFRATGRIMGPMYLVLLALSVGANLSVRIFDSSESTLLDILGGLIMVAFGISIVAILVMSFVLMINRFRTNLMSDEGYMMFTLPVSVHELVWSKIIVSTVWFVATFLAVCISGLIVAFRISYINGFVELIKILIEKITAYYALNGAAVTLEIVLLILVSCAGFCLLFYASMAVGHSFSTRKKLMSVIFFFAFQFIVQTVGSIFLVGIRSLDFDWINWNLTTVGAVHAALWLSIAGALIYAAVLYAITTTMLKKRLNLE
ncbi:MAG: hypothetical protein GX847_04275 [Clostridiales bacterium]|nr:hypothetical protein [Clostridiales bacterium]